MTYLLNNWYIIIACLSVAALAIVCVWQFSQKPTKEQLEAVREWLVYAVSSAEAELGSGTGQLKLRHVYDMFVERFPTIALFITFAEFGKMVDDALVTMRQMLANNKAISELIVGSDDGGATV